MTQQLPRPTDHVEVYWFSEQPYGHVTDADLEQYESGRLGFPNTYFDLEKAHVLYNQYHEQYAWADEVGFDGIMSNEHHASYWCMKSAVNLDAAVIAKVTTKAKIAIWGTSSPSMTPSAWPKRSPCWTAFPVAGSSPALYAGRRWRLSRPALTPRRTGAVRGGPRPHHQVLDDAGPLPV